jgi:hypothetical protein
MEAFSRLSVTDIFMIVILPKHKATQLSDFTSLRWRAFWRFLFWEKPILSTLKVLAWEGSRKFYNARNVKFPLAWWAASTLRCSYCFRHKIHPGWGYKASRTARRWGLADLLYIKAEAWLSHHCHLRWKTNTASPWSSCVCRHIWFGCLVIFFTAV